MAMIRHAIRIGAPRERVYRALTDVGELSAWHDGDVAGAVEVGATLSLEAKPGLQFGWKTTELQEGARIVQECVESPSGGGRTLTFELSSDGSGNTIVMLSDGEWEENDSSLPFCTTHWERVLLRLKDHAEARS